MANRRATQCRVKQRQALRGRAAYVVLEFLATCLDVFARLEIRRADVQQTPWVHEVVQRRAQRSECAFSARGSARTGAPAGNYPLRLVSWPNKWPPVRVGRCMTTYHRAGRSCSTEEASLGSGAAGAGTDSRPETIESAPTTPASGHSVGLDTVQLSRALPPGRPPGESRFCSDRAACHARRSYRCL